MPIYPNIRKAQILKFFNKRQKKYSRQVVKSLISVKSACEDLNYTASIKKIVRYDVSSSDIIRNVMENNDVSRTNMKY